MLCLQPSLQGALLLLTLTAHATSASSWFPQFGRGPRQSRATAVPIQPEKPQEEASLSGGEDESAYFRKIVDALKETSRSAEASSEVLPPIPAALEFQEIELPQVPEGATIKLEAPPGEETHSPAYSRRYGYERLPGGAVPRNVEGLSSFGLQMSENGGLPTRANALPQLALTNPEPPVMNLLNGVGRGNGLLRQADNGLVDTGAGDNGLVVTDSSDDEVRCIPKVMQIEETVYDRAIKCQHSYQEKCHMTYITDYTSTTEQKCETTFKKNCHITFLAMPFNETVNVCHTPVVRQCGNEPVGPDICSTHYETNCETRYKQYEIEQDEPVCVMEIMTKCQNITLPIFPGESRAKRQAADAPAATDDDVTSAPPTQLETVAEEDGPQAGGQNPQQEGVTIEQQCEEWPVQKCTLEKKLVKKVHPDTSCRKIPREVCIPNNCAMVQGEEICRDESRMQIQNVPEEECDLQPEENCKMEAVLVPRLVEKPNCIKVPKEICVNTKKNPRRVKKPVVKEWCYRPKDLIENPGTIPQGLIDSLGNVGEEDSAPVPPQRASPGIFF